MIIYKKNKIHLNKSVVNIFGFLFKAFKILSYLFFLIILLSLVTNRLLLDSKISIVSSKVTHFLFEARDDFKISSFEDFGGFIKGFVLGVVKKDELLRLDLTIEHDKLLNIYNESTLASTRNYYSADLIIQSDNKNNKFKVKVRGKGDREIHYENITSMSYRAKLKGQDRLFGIKKFSIQDPILRNYSWEYLISEIVKQQNLLSLRSWPVNFYVNGDYKGIYSIEEVPSKDTIEQQKRKNGPIFGLDEEISTNLDSRLDPYELDDWQDSYLFLSAKDLLYSSFLDARNGKTFSNQVFDFEEWAKYFALMDIFGSYHGAIPKSVKFYFNPVIGKFQPILFDAHMGAGKFNDFALLDFAYDVDKVHCVFDCLNNQFFKAFIDNKDFMLLYIKFLEEYTKPSFLSAIIDVYESNFEHLDNKFYSTLSPADHMFFRGQTPYYFKFDRIENRQNMLSKKLNKFVDFYNNKLVANHVSAKDNFIIPSDNIKIVHHYDFNMVGTEININEPTVFFFEGNTIIKGISVDQPLTIRGPGMFVFNSENTLIENVIFQDVKNISIANRNLSGAINIYNSKLKIENLEILDPVGEDAINIIDSYFEIGNLKIQSSYSDAIDLDFSDGYILNLHCNNIGNDCLDASESKVSVDKIIANNIEDKAVSAGENSFIEVKKVIIKDSAIGLVSKDGSSLNVLNADFNNVTLPIAVFRKKPSYRDPAISITNINASEEVFGLFSEGSEININNQINSKFLSSNKIEELLYGAVYGKATEK